MNPLQKAASELRNVWQTADWRTAASYTLAAGARLPAIVRQKNLEPADRAMRGRTCLLSCDADTRVELDGKHFAAAREIFCRRVYFALPGFTIRETDYVVDLGANIGLFTVLAAAMGRKVVAVEAQSGFLPIIQENLRRNGLLDRAAVQHGIVGPGTGVFADDPSRAGASHWGKEPPVLSIPDLLARHDLPRIDFLKSDIEGSEFDLFRGDLGWLRQVRQAVFEVHPDFAPVEIITDPLRAAGFTVTLVNDEKRVVSSLFDMRSGYVYAVRETSAP